MKMIFLAVGVVAREPQDCADLILWPRPKNCKVYAKKWFLPAKDDFTITTPSGVVPDNLNEAFERIRELIYVHRGSTQTGEATLRSLEVTVYVLHFQSFSRRFENVRNAQSAFLVSRLILGSKFRLLLIGLPFYS